MVLRRLFDREQKDITESSAKRLVGITKGPYRPLVSPS